MISGRQAMAEVAQQLQSQQQALEATDARMDALRAEQQGLVQQHAEQVKALAAMRVDLVADGGQGRLDAAEKAAAAVLKERDAAREALQREIDDARAASTRLEAELAEQAEVLQQAADALDAAESQTQARLQADADYRAKLERTREAERVAKHADEKAAESEREQDTKAAAYQADPLFMYLWRRRYGTPEYRGRLLFKWLDGKVARLIGFVDARLGYQRLLELAPRLREHAQRMQERAGHEVEALRALDEAARDADGITELVQRRDAEQAAIDALEQRIAETDEQIDALLERRAGFTAGEDEYSQRAISALAKALADRDLAELERAARATPFPEDDAVVEALVEIDRKRRRLAFMLEQTESVRSTQHYRLRELTQLRQEMRERRMDRPGSSFEDKATIALLLANFVSGAIDRRRLLRALEEQYRYRPPRTDPTFGSGRFPGGSPWGGRPPIGRSGGGRGGGGFGGGGFGSGGGFGGGGFRTGGGF